MKKILSILLFSLIASHAFGADLKIINQTNTKNGWSIKIVSAGKYITGFRYVREKGDIIEFYNLPDDYTIKINSRDRIAQQTGGKSAKSSRYVTLSKDINSNKNTTAYIKECTAEDHHHCKHPLPSDDKDDASMGQDNICYYVEQDEIKSTLPNVRM
ncbi:MAG: hypothetical protein ABIF12_01695 [bacterium]